MKTDDLIRALAADPQPRPSRVMPLLAVLVPVLALCAVMLWQILGFRADLAQSLRDPFSALRFALTGTLGLAALAATLHLARPEAQPGRYLWPLFGVAAVAAGLWLWTYLITPPDARQMAVVGKTMTTCLITIPALSVLPVMTILAALRQGATTRPALAGTIAGLGGGALAAAIYALHCTEDNPLFFVTWYSLAIAGVALASGLIGSRVLRW